MNAEKLDIKHILEGEQTYDNLVVEGWLSTKRDAKAFSFIELNDGSSVKNLQVIVDGKLDNYENIKKLTTGASIRVEGSLIKSPAKGQKFELQAKNILIYGEADPETYPIQKKDLTLDYLRSVAHIRPRTRLFGAVYRVRSELAYAVHTYFHERGYHYVHTPIITASDCEGAGAMFQVTTLDLEHLPKTKAGKVDFKEDFFEKKAYLTVSGQLEGELMAMGLGKVYTFGPTFRAEKSITYRHAAEFWMIEPEMAFYELPELMSAEEEFVKYLIKHILDKCPDEMAFFEEKIEPGLIERLKHVLNSEFKKVSYTEAIDILIKSKEQFEVKPAWGIDMNSEHEKYLTEKHFKGPIIVYNYPKDIKAFYMKQNDDEKTVRGTDVLVPKIGEIIGGSQREESYDKLVTRIKEMGLHEDDYSWYLDTRRYGTVPHSGFGLGFERFVMFVTGMNNIRDVALFPRNYKSIEY